MNKIKKIYIIIIATIVLLLLENSSFATTGKVNTETLNLRKEASTTSSILKLLNFGEEIEILEESGDWYKVKAKGTTGYVHKDYVKVDENTNNNGTQSQPSENEILGNEQNENQPSNNEGNNENSNNNEEVSNNEQNSNGEANNPETNNNKPENNNESNNGNNNETNIKVVTNIDITISKDTNVYILPLLNSNVISNLKENNKIKLIAYANGWLYIQNDSISGWVRIENIKENIFINVESNENQNNTSGNNDTNNGISNNNSNTISNTINVNEQNGNNQTNNEQSNTTTANNDQTSNEIQETPITEKTMYVNYSSIYVRSGPGTNYSIVDSLIKNAGVRVIAESGDWYKVKVSNKTGYIAKRLLSNTTTSDGTSRGDVDRTEEDITQSEDKPTNNVEASNKVQNTTEASNSKGEQIVEFAKRYLGCKYVYGGSGPSTFDCSGFTMYVYRNFGISLSHSATAQSKNGVYVAKEDLKLGDLVFFKDYQTMDGIGHCGIYIGNGEFIHASSGTGYCVKISTLLSGSYNTRYSTARRLI